MAGNNDFMSSDAREILLPLGKHLALLTHGNQYAVHGGPFIIKRHARITSYNVCYTKLLRDIVVTMGCNVECPYLPCRYREDWGLDDPSGMEDEKFLEVMNTIEANIINLKERIDNKSV